MIRAGSAAARAAGRKWGRPAAALAVGWIWALAFPRTGVAGLAWIAPGLLLWLGAGVSGRQCFQLGYLAGLTHFLGSLAWLLHIPYPVGAFAGWLALSAFLALFPAIWSWWIWRVAPAVLTREVEADGAGFLAVARSLGSSEGWGARVRWGWTIAAAWVLLEWVRGWIFGGFPWNFLGASQWQILPVAQWAAVTGIYGVSFLLVWFSAGLVFAAWALIGRPAERWGWQREVLLPFLGASAVVAFGFARLAGPTPAGNAERLRFALIQPSIPQTLIWDPDGQPARFRSLMQLSESALREPADVLVWPEAAMPPITAEHFGALTNLVARERVWMVFGADDFEADPEQGRQLAFNAAFLFGPEGTYRASYRKQRLVMFGEFVPLARWLPFLRRLTPIEGGFTPGNGPVAFEIGERRLRGSVLICFEDVFPASGRSHALLGVDFLLNLTNDGWFGRASAQWQHGASAVFRAIETGLPLVRATNNGLTCWTDAYGRLHALLQDADGSVYGTGYLHAEVPLVRGGVPTVYRSWGDWFVVACLGLCLTRGLAARRSCAA